ncbi:MAG: SDR family oxidoreductase, partial [Caldilineaceae bacterium]
MGTYLIVGGTGNVGGALARHLAEAGHTVHVGTRAPAKVQPAAGMKAVEFDYDRSATWAPAFAGADGAFFLNLGAPP